MSHKGYSILSRQELEKLTTKRLLALKKKLYPLRAKAAPEWERESTIYLEISDQIDLIKEVCKTREHVT